MPGAAALLPLAGRLRLGAAVCSPSSWAGVASASSEASAAAADACSPVEAGAASVGLEGRLRRRRRGEGPAAASASGETAASGAGACWAPEATLSTLEIVAWTASSGASVAAADGCSPVEAGAASVGLEGRLRRRRRGAGAAASVTAASGETSASGAGACCTSEATPSTLAVAAWTGLRRRRLRRTVVSPGSSDGASACDGWLPPRPGCAAGAAAASPL